MSLPAVWQDLVLIYCKLFPRHSSLGGTLFKAFKSRHINSGTAVLCDYIWTGIVQLCQSSTSLLWQSTESVTVQYEVGCSVTALWGPRPIWQLRKCIRRQELQVAGLHYTFFCQKHTLETKVYKKKEYFFEGPNYIIGGTSSQYLICLEWRGIDFEADVLRACQLWWYEFRTAKERI